MPTLSALPVQLQSRGVSGSAWRTLGSYHRKGCSVFDAEMITRLFLPCPTYIGQLLPVKLNLFVC